MAAPEADEFEVSVFGRGVGEAVAVHLGCGSWLAVDSCLDDQGQPASLAYLARIGVSSDAVVALVLTHWHDDHVRGAADILDACPEAELIIPCAYTREDFLTLVEVFGARAPATEASGAKEIDRVLALALSGRRTRHAVADRLLWARSADGTENLPGASVYSLSPTDDGVVRGLLSLMKLIPSHAQTVGRIPNPGANELSAALVVEVGSVRVLLGADLEARGWIEIGESSTVAATDCTLVKVPHHGSDGADCPELWESWMAKDRSAVLTPYARSPFLPKSSDIERILALTGDVHCAGSHARGAFEASDRVVRRTLDELGVKVRSVTGRLGHVRFRRRAGLGGAWRVEHHGDASAFSAA